MSAVDAATSALVRMEHSCEPVDHVEETLAMERNGEQLLLLPVISLTWLGIFAALLM